MVATSYTNGTPNNDQKTKGTTKLACTHSKRTAEDSNQWSKSKKKRMRLLKAKHAKGKTQSATGKSGDIKNNKATAQEERPGSQEGVTIARGESSALSEKFSKRLSGSRFRKLNEELYTTTSVEAFKRFTQHPTLFEEYHAGFRRQAEQWPLNPVSILSRRIILQARRTSRYSTIHVADFGCGDAALAKQLHEFKIRGTCPFIVSSFDFVAAGPNAELITASDIARTPLPDRSIDVGIFCLSLMGTNMADFIREAHRVLKSDARLHVAEVRSRFESRVGKGEQAEKELGNFLGVLDKLGFECLEIDRSSKMFVLIELKKNGKVPLRSLVFTAKACIYKRR